MSTNNPLIDLKYDEIKDNPIVLKKRDKFESFFRVISIVIAIMGIVFTVIAFYLTHPRKELTFSIEKSMSLVETNQFQNSRLKVLFDGYNVKNIFRTECLLKNTGNQPITKQDINNTLTIGLNSDSRLLDSDISSNPTNIDIDKDFKKSGFNIKPDLLNPSDFITLTVYYTSDCLTNYPNIDGRIVGGKIKSLNNANANLQNKNKFIIPMNYPLEKVVFWITLVLNLCAVFFIIGYFSFENSGNIYSRSLFIFFFSVGIILSSLFLISNELL